MVESNILDYIYQVNGESIQKGPVKIFDPSGVYLIIDPSTNTIWIWAGKYSRLFHRYIAANWAGKLKSNKRYYNFKYEMIKQENEPMDFFFAINEIERKDSNKDYSEQIKDFKLKRNINLNINNSQSSLNKTQINLKQSNTTLSNLEITQIKMVLTDIKEMQKQIKLSYQQIDKRINEIELKLKM